MNSLIEFENIAFSYEGNSQPTLEKFSLKIPEGKKCAVLGQNGSGKSTVFLLANGLLKPKKGTIYWKNAPLHYKKKELKVHRNRTGLFFQNAEEMFMSPIVSDDIAYGLINAGYSGNRLQQKVEQVISRFNLESLKERPIHRLSLGEKRRVALAGIIALEPELFMLDEPTTYLDPVQIQTFLRELEKIHQAGTTIMMATHDLDLAYEWADWVIVLEKGQVVFEGQPDELFINEPFVLEIGLAVPLLFKVKQLLKMDSLRDSSFADSCQSKDEIVSCLTALLGKKGEK